MRNIKEKGLEGAPLSIPIPLLKIISNQAEKCLYKIKCNDNGTGTGFFCAIPFPNKYNLLPVLITNNHVIGKDDININKKINFSINDDENYFEILIDD